MIISRTPLRISFVGGGTDIREFYQNHKGSVLSSSINKYAYVMTHPFFNSKQILLKYSDMELVHNVDEIKHPIFREVLRFLDIKGGLEITTNADVPAGTGMGSSSSFTVGLLNCLYAYLGKNVSKEKLAKEACKIEIDILKEPIGKQDQYISAFGSINFIEFFPNETVSVSPIIMSEKCRNKLNENLIMFYTGMSRSASKILKNQITSIKKEDNIKIMAKMAGLAEELRKKLNKNDLSSFGSILNKGWLLKKKLAHNITNPIIEKYYAKAIQNGATGGKILGAGGGGFLLFYADRKNHDKIRKSLGNLVELTFRFDNEGSRIIYYADEH